MQCCWKWPGCEKVLLYKIINIDDKMYPGTLFFGVDMINEMLKLIQLSIIICVICLNDIDGSFTF